MLNGVTVGKRSVKGNSEVDTKDIPTQTSDPWATVWIMALMFSLIVPTYLSINVFGLRFSVYRFVILIAFLPALIRYSKCKTKTSADGFVFLLSALMMVAMLVSDGLNGIAFSLSLVMETLGTYLIARSFIYDKQNIFLFIKSYYVVLLLIIFPLLYESLTSINLFGVPPRLDPELYKRFGFYRAQGPFDHPILCSLFVASGLSLLYISSRRRIIKNIPVLLGVFSTVSTAGFLMVALQGFLLANKKFASYALSRYLAFLAVAYVVVDMISNRPPLAVLASYLALNKETAYYRILQLRFGSDNIADHPFFGIGLGEWVRPEWLPPSIDNFYLVIALRYGLPALMCLLYVIFLALRATYSDKQSELHIAFRILLVTFSISIYSVHIWSSVSVFFWMIVGICVNLQFIKTDNSSINDGHRAESPVAILPHVKS